MPSIMDMINTSRKEKALRDNYVKKLKPRKRRREYKNEDAYIDAVYRNNRDFIDSRIVNNTSVSNKTLFKRQVKQYLNETNSKTGKKYNISEAIDRVKRSRLITTKQEQGLHNKNFEDLEKQAYKDIKKQAKLKNKSQYNSNAWEFLGYGTLANGDMFLAYHSIQNGQHVYMIVIYSPKGNAKKDVRVMGSQEWHYGWEPFMR